MPKIHKKTARRSVHKRNGGITVYEKKKKRERKSVTENDGAAALGGTDSRDGVWDSPAKRTGAGKSGGGGITRHRRV